MVTYQTESEAVDGLFVRYDHVESVLVVHDRSKAHDAQVHIVWSKVPLELGRLAEVVGHPALVQLRLSVVVAPVE